MLRLTSVLILAALPAQAEVNYAALDCTLTLVECDMHRAPCTSNAPATAYLRGEGEEWTLTTLGVNNSEDTSGKHTETFQLFTAMTEPVRSYFIGFHDTVDGSFTHDAEGNAKMHIVVKHPEFLFEEYFAGTCTSPAQ